MPRFSVSLRLQRPRVLHEEADVVRLDVADGHRAHDVVVAVRALDAAAVVEGICLIPEQLHRRRLLARQRVVYDALDLQAALDRVLAAPVRVTGHVGVEVEAAQAAASRSELDGLSAEAVDLLQVRRDVGVRAAGRTWRRASVADVVVPGTCDAARSLNVPTSC